MKHFIIAWKLREIADLSELLDENSFKVRAFRQAASELEQLDTDLDLLYHEGRLTEINGVGKSIAGLIEEMIITNESKYLLELRQRVVFSELLDIPGIGLNLVKRLYESLGITNLNELKAALEAHKIRELPGMNSRTELKLSTGLQQMSGLDGQILLGTALPIARELIKRLKLVKGVLEVQITGSVRRYCETVSDIDLLVKTTDKAKVISVFTNLPECKEVLEIGEERALILTRYGIKVEVITVEPADYPLKLFLTTGQKHVRQVEEMAREQGIICNYDHWLNSHGQKLFFACEAEIYQSLGLSFVIPELREGQGELTAALEGWLPKSVALSQIRGDLHMHTRWSDGVNSLEEMAKKGSELGYEYMAICDHSKSLKIAKGMSIEVLLEQMKAIDDLNEQLSNFRLLKGVEVDILKDGRLDYPDEILAKLDVVVASIHTGFKGSKEELTARLIKAMENPHVDIIAHPTGRLIGRRSPYELDVEEVISKAKETNTVLEINASPNRLDLYDEHLKLCKANQVKVVINSDAHSVGQLDYLEYGVGMARRGWLEDRDVINTYSLNQLLAFFQNHKSELCT